MFLFCFVFGSICRLQFYETIKNQTVNRILINLIFYLIQTWSFEPDLNQRPMDACTVFFIYCSGKSSRIKRKRIFLFFFVLESIRCLQFYETIKSQTVNRILINLIFYSQFDSLLFRKIVDNRSIPKQNKTKTFFFFLFENFFRIILRGAFFFFFFLELKFQRTL